MIRAMGQKPHPDAPKTMSPFADLLNLVRQAAAGSERTQQAAKYSEMSANAAALAGQQAMIRAMGILATKGAPTPNPFAALPHKLYRQENKPIVDGLCSGVSVSSRLQGEGR